MDDSNLQSKKLGGQVIQDHRNLHLELEDDIIEYRRAMEPDIMARIYETAHNAKNQDLYKGKDFYIVLLTFIDRVLKQPRIIPIARRSCPTPVYKQSVWKYHHESGTLEFFWSIPDAMLYYHILRNQVKFLEDKETADIARFVILMESEKLLDWVKKENGEKRDAVIRNNIQTESEEENLCLTM
jgi:hypothetical protein